MPRYRISIPFTILPERGGFPSNHVAAFSVDAATREEAESRFVTRLGKALDDSWLYRGKPLDLTPLKCPTCGNEWGTIPLSGCPDTFHGPRDVDDPEDARPLPAVVKFIEDNVRQRLQGGAFASLLLSGPATATVRGITGSDGWWHIDFVFNRRAVSVQIDAVDKIAVALIHTDGDATTEYCQATGLGERDTAIQAVDRVVALLTQ